MTYYITYSSNDALMLHHKVKYNSDQYNRAILAGGEICGSDTETDIVLTDRDVYRSITGQ
jgi:hypothetical protein